MAKNLQMSFSTKDLVDILKENRAKHAEDAKKLREDYRVALIKLLKSKINKLEAGKHVSSYTQMPEPFDYLEDYDEAIAMLEATTDTHISLDSQQYAQYARDNWARKDQFVRTSQSYASLDDSED